MTLASPEIVLLLRALANVIEKGDSQLVSRLTEELSKPLKSSNKNSEQDVSFDHDSLLETVMSELVSFDSREKGVAYLKDARLTKRQLIAIGKKNKIYIAKSDTIAVLEDKIVEALLGSKLSSKAVRGK
ncbi:MAG: hypothetical protein ABF751_05115 [Acetobacter orientalis]|uniref:hypothetical protein n=1 Tax=Acetobacter orientalis TaxID=146474 RepID=UPI0039E98276